MYGSVETEREPSSDRREADSSQKGISWRLGSVLAVFGVIAIAVVALNTERTPADDAAARYSAMSADDKEQLFIEFKEKFAKTYVDDKEEGRRKEIFMENLEYIDELNAKSSGATYAWNLFADLRPEEFKQQYLTFRKTSDVKTYTRSIALLPGEVTKWSEDTCQSCHRFPEFDDYDYDTQPSSFDWRDYGAVTGVKNQASCGSCWAFSAVGDMEGSWYLAGEDLISLSEQQLVACDTHINSGCHGGWPELAFMYVERVGGIVSEEDYEYKQVNMYTDAVSQPNCDADIVQKKYYSARIDYWQKISSSATEEYKMTLALIKAGPISVALNADGMQFYSSGVDDPSNCSPSGVDHAVVLVGYGMEDNQEYWLIKNSWSDAWGEDGYYKLIRNKNACGIAEYATHTIVRHTIVGKSD